MKAILTATLLLLNLVSPTFAANPSSIDGVYTGQTADGSSCSVIVSSTPASVELIVREGNNEYKAQGIYKENQSVLKAFAHFLKMKGTISEGQLTSVEVKKYDPAALFWPQVTARFECLSLRR